MMKHIKKSLAFLLTMCMILGCFGTAYATEIENRAAEAEEVISSETAEDTEAEKDADAVEEVEESSEDTEATTEEAFNSEEENAGAGAKAASVNMMALDTPSTLAEMDTITKTKSVPLDTSKFYKVFHLDCGRKYFTVAQIKTIIDKMAANDYNTLELAIGNDGLRFILDDMSVTANGKTYSSADVTAAIKAGNKAYYDAGTNELTQSEMDEIIAYAKAKGISILPLVNSPGHMDAILTAMKQLGISNPQYSTSVRTVDITNAEATNFTMALVNKYITYFAGKGSTMFNMGADEYANDIQSQPQFAGLISSGKYSYFVTYVNNVAAMIQNAGMTPVAFNDGIYYNQNTSGGTFDTNIVISYWSSGWSGYNVASASYLANKGFKILNTNGDWYYVTNQNNISNAVTNIKKTPYNYVMGTGTMDVVGCMICTWCDEPAVAYVESDTLNQIATFAEENSAEGEPFYKSATVDPDPVDPGESEAANEKTITLTVGESKEEKITGANYAGSYNTEDTNIATVSVTGTDEVVGSQVETAVTSVSSNQSYYIKNSSGQYLNASGQFVSGIENAAAWTWNGSKFKNGNNYLRYNNGWTTTTRNNSATTLYFNNGTFYRSRSGYNYSGYTYSNPLGSPVTYTTTAPVAASTTITFSGKTAGTTIVTIGNTKYTIVVKPKTETVSLVVGGVKTYSDTTASTAVSADPSVATVAANGNNLVITGVKAGKTTVKTTNCTYTVTVTAEDLSNKNTTIEFWITNTQVTANGATSMTVNAATSTINSADGAAIADLVPLTGSRGSDAMVYWKTVRLASDNMQTTASGVDKTLAGTDFTRIRYYNGSWAYYDGTTWTDFASGDQIVAYYLQKTEVTDEVTTLVVDWGPVKANWGDLAYLGTKYVLLDYSVKYESGEEAPTSFTNEKTLAFHCDVSTQKNGTYYRTIGMTLAEETSDYEVYMITATPTSDSTSSTLASTAAGNGTISYNGTEKVVWAETQADIDNSGLDTWTSISGTYTYSVGGEPKVPGMEIYRQQGMKITYYVRAKVTEDSLTVNYVNETTGENFYNYNIAVISGTTFNSGIKLANPWKANLTNGSVTNSLGKTQTVSADLSTMPAIGVSYRYSDYTCTKVERSEDGKTVTLYYTFNNVHSYVVDFGLPLHISTTDLGISGDWSSATVTNAKYGTASVTVGKGLDYAPNQTLKGVEQLSLNLSDGTSKTTHIIYIYPATTVYYEEGFAEYTGTWNGGSKGTTAQTLSEVKATKSDSAAVYGYDVKYANEATGSSNGTAASSDAKGNKATFTFTGTGFDVYANTSTASGNVVILVKKNDATYKMTLVNTVMKNGSSSSTDDQEVTAYSEPIYSLTGLERATYSITITTSASPISIDGFRVYGTLDTNNTVYVNDLEDNPDYIELRNQVLEAYNASAAGNEQVYKSNESANNATVAIISNTADYSAETVADLLANGPKNELYLQPGQAITFSVTTARKVQIGMKALNAATKYQINGNSSVNITSSTDMFYEIPSGQVVIKNDGSGILAITKLKICDAPAELAALSEEDIEAAVAIMNAEPTEPEVTYSDAILSISLKDYTGKTFATTSLTANGIAGETATFSATDIQAAAEAVLPSGYGFAATAADAAVVYGENGSAELQIGKVATLKITYKKGKKVVGTATLTAVQTSKTSSYTFSTTQIKAATPAGYTTISVAGTKVNFGSTKSINATCY